MQEPSSNTKKHPTEEQLRGCLWGLALGDAIGLPNEGLSPQRIQRWRGDQPLEHALIGGRGMVSDDTEHHSMTAQAWLAAKGSPERFARSLGWRLRGWLLGLPAGVGMATLRSLCKLWLGFPPHKSGVFSAGNGPAMRAPILGLLCDKDDLVPFVRASTRLTHTDPKAEHGAMLVAWATRLSAGLEDGVERIPQSLAEALCERAEGDELCRSMEALCVALKRGDTPATFAAQEGLDKGITGYINHTLPVALYCWLYHWGDFRAAIESAVRLGGDTDTVAAIVGGIAGASTQTATFPDTWRKRMWEAPRSLAWMASLATRLTQQRMGTPTSPQPLAWWLLPLRNVLFLSVVLAHGFRRLLPPYR